MFRVTMLKPVIALVGVVIAGCDGEQPAPPAAKTASKPKATVTLVYTVEAGEAADVNRAAEQIEERLAGFNAVQARPVTDHKAIRIRARMDLTVVRRWQRFTEQLDAARAAGQTKRAAELVAAYEQETGALDPDDLRRLIEASGLAFHITVLPDEVPDAAKLRQQLERGEQIVSDGRMKWLRLHDPAMFAGSPAELAALGKNPAAYFAQRRYVGAEAAGGYYLLTWNTPQRSMLKRWPDQVGWAVEHAGQSVDQGNFPAISIRLNAQGSRVMRRLSDEHIGRSLAIVVNEQVLSAPTIQTTLGGDIQISGGMRGFRPKQQQTLLQALSADLAVELSPQPVAVQIEMPD